MSARFEQLHGSQRFISPDRLTRLYILEVNHLCMSRSIASLSLPVFLISSKSRRGNSSNYTNCSLDFYGGLIYIDNSCLTIAWRCKALQALMYFCVARVLKNKRACNDFIALNMRFSLSDDRFISIVVCNKSKLFKKICAWTFSNRQLVKKKPHTKMHCFDNSRLK